MKALYIECNMGAAGDMLMSALSELCNDSNSFIENINSVIKDAEIIKKQCKKCGITGTHTDVLINGKKEEHHHEHEHIHTHHHEHIHTHHHEHIHGHHHEHIHTHHHEHYNMQSINNIIDGFDIADNIKEDIKAVYHIIADAESRVHGCSIENIHFHEVGSIDAVADITGVCMLIDMLRKENNIEKIIVSPIRTGYGSVRCSHGIMPVPAPATAYILKNIPIYSGNIKGEMITPTGAALLKHFADTFENMPCMKMLKIGYGMGTKDFDAVNAVRAVICELE